jgi:hypothetical protein
MAVKVSQIAGSIAAFTERKSVARTRNGVSRRSTILIGIVALFLALGSSAQAENAQAKLTLKLERGKFYLSFKNISAQTVTLPTYRWVYELKGWNAKGILLTNEAAYLAKVDMMAMQDSDWLILRPGATQSIQVDFYSSNGVVSAKIQRAEVLVRKLVSKPPKSIQRKGILVAKMHGTSWLQKQEGRSRVRAPI